MLSFNFLVFLLSLQNKVSPFQLHIQKSGFKKFLLWTSAITSVLLCLLPISLTPIFPWHGCLTIFLNSKTDSDIPNGFSFVLKKIPLPTPSLNSYSMPFSYNVCPPHQPQRNVHVPGLLKTWHLLQLCKDPRHRLLWTEERESGKRMVENGRGTFWALTVCRHLIHTPN